MCCPKISDIFLDVLPIVKPQCQIQTQIKKPQPVCDLSRPQKKRILVATYFHYYYFPNLGTWKHDLQ